VHYYKQLRRKFAPLAS